MKKINLKLINPILLVTRKRDRRKLYKRYYKTLKRYIYIYIKYNFLRNVNMQSFLRKDLFINLFFFTKFHEDSFKIEKNLVLKNNSWTYYNYYFIHPFFVFEKQFLFNRLDFELFIFQKNLNLIFSKNNILPGSNFWIKEIDFDQNLLIPKNEEEEKLFFQTYFYSTLVKFDLYKYIYNFNFFLYLLYINSIYQCIIFVFQHSILKKN